MKKVIVMLAAVVFCFIIPTFADEPIWEEVGRGNTHLRTVLVDPHIPRIIYLGADKGVMKTEDAAASWRNILSVRGQSKAVNSLLFGPLDKNSLYAATGNGLYYSFNRGKDWKRIFHGKNYLEDQCTALAVSSDTIFLGTKGGLFVSQDRGLTWHKETANLGNSHILAIAYNLKEPNYIYVASTGGVFKTEDNGRSWERTFIAQPQEVGNETEEITEDQDEEEKSSNLRYISIDPNNANYLYLATSRGVYISQDKGENWEPLSSFGLLNRDVRFLVVSAKSELYAVTKSGVFTYRSNRWQELSLGLVAEDIKSLALDNQNNLYAASDKGLFKTRLRDFSNNKCDNIISLYYKDELSINQVQQAAIRYAEVEPEKILRWRKQAKMKAILPKLTVGIDNSKSTNYEIYTSAITRYVYEGPDDSSSGWDVTLSWDLSELIWNDDQTSIDVRSRLMVELRDDILDEVTKLYFERIRVKKELDDLSIEDRKKRFEKELRLKELTASLDALTGGYFSRSIKSDKT